MMEEEIDIRQTILNVIEDTVSKFFYYDRKDDEELGVGDLSDAIESGIISVNEIVMAFKDSIENGVE